MAFNKTIGRDFNLGFPGTPSRSIDVIINSFPLDGTVTELGFGLPVVLNTNKEAVRPFAAGDAAAAFIGLTVRNVKSERTYMADNPAYGAGDEVDVLTRGNMSVLVAGTPVKGAPVYALPDGTLTADSGATDAVALTGVIFTHNGKDANNVTEVAILERKY